MRKMPRRKQGLIHWRGMQNTLNFLRRNGAAITGAGLFLLSFLFHLVPFFLYGAHPLGYDTGFYRRYLIEPFVSFPNAPVPGMGNDALVPRIILDALRALHVQTDFALYGSYIFFFALLPVLLFIFLRPRLGNRGAAIAGILIIFSPVQYNEYWYMLFKNAFALDLLIAVFIALEKKYLYLAFALDIALALSHKTTAIMYLAALGLLFVFWKTRRREMLTHAFLTAACLGAVAYPLLHQVSLALPVALFIDWQTYLWFSAPLLVCIAAGWRGFREKNIPDTVIALGIVSIAFVLLRLPFYERIFVFSDMALVVFAACALEYLLSKTKLRFAESFLYWGALCIAVGLFLGTVYNQVRSLEPLMTAKSINRIEAVGKMVPAEATILTTSDEAPWFEGWTMAHIAAPGMLHDSHNLEEWTEFWNATSTDKKISFLNDFASPLYLSTLGTIEDLVGKSPSCVTPIAPDLWQNTCAPEK